MSSRRTLQSITAAQDVVSRDRGCHYFSIMLSTDMFRDVLPTSVQVLQDSDVHAGCMCATQTGPYPRRAVMLQILDSLYD